MATGIFVSCSFIWSLRCTGTRQNEDSDQRVAFVSEVDVSVEKMNRKCSHSIMTNSSSLTMGMITSGVYYHTRVLRRVSLRQVRHLVPRVRPADSS